ncbi:hypothetical protein VII00023_12753 [Vibrio ichthyoenteri ATCC 700023]|uniref:DUF2059 domain-containing protein n=1 Tax=Vibrio ichthyoenteri ATCC 700023 TaxID=870968 RepID=F9S2E1_9VIBR|nr:DUF2059 domain-containing protein [Vibrio ichthyoenteri]EGU39628.1 hypothetical protein VII00023_12753 [Vibrio ichthyoenteri ATCC 700023]
MKALLGFVLSIGLVGSAYASTSPSNESVEKMLQVMKIDEQILGGFEAMLPIVNQLAQRMELNSSETEQLKDIYRDWFNNDLDQELIKQQVVDLYAETFTEQDIQNMIQFYQTPTGQKTIEKAPELAKMGAQFGMVEAQKKQQQLMEKLTPFLEKHQIN